MGIFVTLMVCALVGYYWWSNRKPVAAYRPTREDVLILLRKVNGGLNNELEWATFISLPIENDEKLEDIRKKCAAMNTNKEYFTDLREGFMFNATGIMEIRRLIGELENYVKSRGREKTDFQQSCSQALEHKMDLLGMKISSWEYKDGPEESYYVSEYKGVQLFVYADGASIKSSLGSVMFDRMDFKSEGELTRAAVSKLTEMVSQLNLNKN